MRDLILATIVFALMTIYLAIYSWNKVKKAEENNQNLSDEECSSFGIAVLGMSFGVVLTSFFLYATVKDIITQNYQIEPQTKRIISLEKSGDTVSIYNDENYKIIFDLEKGY
nr:hypothetical protein [uncultured Leptotrichia sp.]